MNAAQRRDAILGILSEAEGSVSASHLAAQFNVSRQIIVGDVALLRAGGANISATPRGYVLEGQEAGLKRTVACRHDRQGTEEELNIMVDNGCTVLDVVVEHPVYGQLTGQLQIASRYDVRQFIERLDAEDTKPLSTLTDGIHLHNLRCPDEAAFQRTCAALRAAGYLLEAEK